jgi:hypothetical protein
VFCKIHPQMEAVVLTVESPYFGVSDRTGYISIGKVPPGTYFLHVWYENAVSQALEALRPIVVGSQRPSIPTISIALAKQVPTTREDSEQQYHTTEENPRMSQILHAGSSSRLCPRRRLPNGSRSSSAAANRSGDLRKLCVRTNPVSARCEARRCCL